MPLPSSHYPVMPAGYPIMPQTYYAVPRYPDAGGSVTLRIRADVEGTSEVGARIEVGDLLQIKGWHAVAQWVDAWLSVTAVGTTGQDYVEYTCDVKRGMADTTLRAGQPVTVYKATDGGYVRILADDLHSPYLEIGTHGDEPWLDSDHTRHVRLGRLDGLNIIEAEIVGNQEEDTETTVIPWGMAVGTDLDDPAAARIVAANTGLELYRVNLEATNSEGDTVVAINSNVGPNGYVFQVLPESGELPALGVKGNRDVVISARCFLDAGPVTFDDANGRVLLGPYTGLSRSAWNTSRGHSATITGAFWPVPGAWPGTTALKLVRTGKNLVENPRFQANTTDWWTTDLGSSAAVTTRPRFGDKCARLTFPAAGTAQISGEVNNAPAQLDGYAAACYVRCDSAQAGNYANLKLNVTGGTAESYEATIALTTEWQRIDCPGLSVEQAAPGGIDLIVSGTGDEGAYMYVDGVVCRKHGWLGEQALSYFDGSLDGCSWDGATDNSTSNIDTSTVLDLDSHVGALNDAQKLTLHFVVRAPHDWSTEPAYWTIMDAAGSESFTDRLTIRYYAKSLREWVFTLPGGVTEYHEMEASQGWKAGDVLYIALVLDIASNTMKFYLNGKLLRKARPQAPNAMETLTATTWKIGGNASTGTSNGLEVSEVAVLETTLDSNAIANRYAYRQKFADSSGFEDAGNLFATNIHGQNHVYIEPVLALTDGVTAPSTVSGKTLIYVDTADGDLKVKFGDGHTAVLAADS